MKVLRSITILCFSLIVLMPVLTFNFKEGAVSEIDNRELAANPFSEEARETGDLTENTENYVNDRIGLRDDMILAYTVLNDRVFGKMVHPSYVYGKDGYVFGAGRSVYPCYSEFHEKFADMIMKIQTYCTERDVPFLFVFNPAKPAVLTQYLPEGQNYDREWVDLFMDSLKERGVRCLDNTETLREKTEKGEVVFNKKFDANHWNDLGALYGTNEILRTLQEDIHEVHVNQAEDVAISEALKETLLVSEFPINETVPSISVKVQCEDRSEEYRDELSLNENFNEFGYFYNFDREEEGAPRALVFQGSYMNEYGYQYLKNGFGEYIYVHDYQNVIDFPYYFNIFKPECVVFEVAEYTITNEYFDYGRMEAMNLNPTLESVLDEGEDLQIEEADAAALSIEKGTKLTKITWETKSEISHGWLELDEDSVYDLMPDGESGNVYSTTVLTEEYERCKDTMKIISKR